MLNFFVTILRYISFKNSKFVEQILYVLYRSSFICKNESKTRDFGSFLQMKDEGYNTYQSVLQTFLYFLLFVQYFLK